MGLLTAWTLAALAHAGPLAEPAYEALWAPARVLGEVEHDGRTWTVFDVPPERDVRVHCKEDGPPERRALLVSRGQVTWVQGPWPEPVADGRSWWLPAPVVGAQGWAIDRSGCSVVARRVVTSAERLDQLEHDATGRDGLRGALTSLGALHDSAQVRAALADEDEIDDWWATYAALRPGGGFVIPRGDRRPQTGRRAPPLPLDDAGRWWQVDEAGAWTVRGPARVLVDARVLGPPTLACLTVDDDAPSCQIATPVQVLGVQDHAAVALAPELDGVEVGRRVRWSLWLPRGVHTLGLDRTALVRTRVLEAGVLAVVDPLPGATRVVPLSDDRQDDRPRVAATPDEDVATNVLFGPAAAQLSDDDTVHWLRPQEVDGAHPWWDDSGRVPVLLDTLRPGEACTIRLPDGHGWTTRADDRLAYFAPPSGVPDDATALPEAAGACSLRLRVTGDTRPHDDAWSAWSVALAGPDAPAILRFDAVPTEPVVLRVHPSSADPVRIEVDAGGEVRAWTVTPATRDTPFLGADGSAWSAPVDLALPPGRPVLAVRASAPVAVRATAWVTEVAPLVPPGSASSDLEALTRAVIDAGSDVERALRLRARAQARAAQGDARGSVTDLVLADALDPAPPDDAASLALARATRAAWQPWDRWVPTRPTWVPDDLGDAVDLAASAAAEADWVGTARLTQGWFPSTPWWLAAARSQTPTAEDRNRAYLGLVTSAVDAQGRPAPGSEPDHPALSAVRAWSGWAPVPGVRGTVGFEGLRAESAEALDPIAWPERWSEDAVRELTTDTVLRLPPLRGQTTLSVRCAAQDAVALSTPCTVSRRDASDRVLEQVELSPWGVTTTMPLSVQSQVTFLTLGATGRVHAQVRLPEALLAATPTSLAARRVTHGGASLDVLGPTVVLLELWAPPGPADAPATSSRQAQVRIDGAHAAGITLRPAPTRVEVPVDGSGAHTVSIETPTGTLLRAWVRTPRESLVEASANRDLARWIRQGGMPGPRVWTGGQASPAPVAATPEPPAPRWSVLGQVRAGVGGDFAEDPEASGTATLRGLQQVGIVSRPGAAPLWVDARIAVHETTERRTVVEARLGGEAWFGSAPWRGWATLDGSVRSGLTSELPTVLRGAAQAGISVRPLRLFEVRANLDLGGATRAGPWSPELGALAPAVLWSTYRDVHRLWLGGGLDLRTYPTPWLRTRTWLTVRTNPPGDARALDELAAGLEIRAAGPSVRGAVGLSLAHRFLDTGRAEPYDAPQVDADLRGTLWAHHDVSVGVRAGAVWQPYFARLSFDTGIDVLWGRGEGWRDLRPTQTDAREAALWRQPDRFIDGPP